MQKQKQGHVERSHRTDDEELYIPHLTKATDNDSFLEFTQNCFWYYNTQRPHQGKYMKLQSPLTYARDIQINGFSNLDKETGHGQSPQTRYLAKEVDLDKFKMFQSYCLIVFLPS